MDYGRWTSTPYTLPGDDRSVVAYSVPLILDDGTVYGVIGVEMLTNLSGDDDSIYGTSE